MTSFQTLLMTGCSHVCRMQCCVCVPSFQSKPFVHLLMSCVPAQSPVPATADKVREEIAAVQDVAGQSCPIRAVLDRVVITSTGVVVACWQVTQHSSALLGCMPSSS